MTPLHITAHAIDRYRQRVSNVSIDDARIALTSPAISRAADFGAPYVRLGTGQRIVIVDHVVVTVLPPDVWVGTMGLDGDRRREGRP